MATGRTSRRRFLQLLGITGGTALISGCNSSLSSLTGPEFDSRYTTEQPTEAVVKSNVTTETGPPYYAALVTSQRQADEILQTEVLPQHAQSDWRSVNYEEEFVAVFLSRFDVLPNESASGSRPASSIEQERFVFSLDVSQDEFYYRNYIYTVLEKWTRNGTDAPQEIVVELTTTE